MPDEERVVLYEQRDDVAILSLNRPESLNALNPPMHDQLAQLLAQARDDDSVRALVLTGEGRAFCAGADLNWTKSGEDRPPAGRPTGTVIPREYRPLGPSGLPQGWFGPNILKPIVAAINGAAVGWAAEALALCDMRVCGERGRIGWVFASRGLVTDYGVGPVMLPKIVGWSQAARLLYSGEIVNAQEALRIGLVDEVVADDELRDRAVELARHLGSGAPLAIATHKRQLWETLTRPAVEIVYDNFLEFARSMETNDFKEGAKSFFEKRKPVWTGT